MEFNLSPCRICKSEQLKSIFNLGNLPLSGKFLFKDQNLTLMPLNLGQCQNCGLLQLIHALPIPDLYSEFYGYESSLNDSMVEHLDGVASHVIKRYSELNEKLPTKIIDIASNDGTLLKKFNEKLNDLELVGIDPLIDFLTDHYPQNSKKISSFFGSNAQDFAGISSASIVTSLSVFYDLDNPIEFAKQVERILENNGIWFLEQSYVYSMLESKSFDTICHEHLLYLRLLDFKRIFENSGFSVIDVNLNQTNGGSIQILAQKRNQIEHSKTFLEYLKLESENKNKILLDNFKNEVVNLVDELREIIIKFHQNDYRIVALGASTKGNILLNFLGLTPGIIELVGEVNEKKFGRVTPGTNIPIVGEDEILQFQGKKQLILILPWHFRETFLFKTHNRVEMGDRILFPLPKIELI